MYEIYLPPDVRALLQQLKIAISLGIEGVPLACVGANGYMKRLQFWMFAPIVLVAVATFTVLTHLLVQAHIVKKGRGGSGGSKNASRMDGSKAMLARGMEQPSSTPSGGMSEKSGLPMLLFDKVMPTVLRIAFLMCIPTGT